MQRTTPRAPSAETGATQMKCYLLMLVASLNYRSDRSKREACGREPASWERYELMIRCLAHYSQVATRLQARYTSNLHAARRGRALQSCGLSRNTEDLPSS